MKKMLSLLVALLVVGSLGLPAFATNDEFVPSVSGGSAPCVVTFFEDGEEIVGHVIDKKDGTKLATVYPGCLYVISLEDANDPESNLSDATRKMIIDLYNEFVNEEIVLSEVLPELNDLVEEKFGEGNNADNMILRDLFLADLVHDDCKGWLVKEDTTLDITFEMDIEEGTFLQVATYIDGEWQLVDKVVNNNEDDNEENDGTVTVTFEDLCPVIFLVPGEMNENAPLPWYWILIVILLAIVGYGYKKFKK